MSTGLRKLLFPIAAFVLSTGCSDPGSSEFEHPTPSAPQTGSSVAQPAEAATGEVHPTVRSISVSPGGGLTDNFEGPGLDFMNMYAKPASPELQADAAQLVSAARDIEECQPSSNRNQAYMVDVDGDGAEEGLLFYTLENCGGPQFATRSLAILKKNEEGKWVSRGQYAISVLAGEKRRVVKVGDGQIVLEGTENGLGEKASPEIISISSAQD